MMLASEADVWPAQNADDVQTAVMDAVTSGKSIIARGAGYSYGDPALNANNTVLDMTSMTRILSWDRDSGIVDVEPGVTIAQLCRHVEPDGWWPPIVPGTSLATVGGAIGANIHGKNNWKLGTFGEHIESVEVILADGSRVTISPESAPERFRGIVGGFGLLGIVTHARLRMIRSGRMHVEQFAAPSLDGVLDLLDRWHDRADYMVAWIDGFARGAEIGRGLVDFAELLTERVHQSKDRHPTLPARFGRAALEPIAGLITPNLWRGFRPFPKRPLMKCFNALQYNRGCLQNGRAKIISQSAFQFHLDALPGWNRAFGPGIIQYQLFVPASEAADVFRASLEKLQPVSSPFLAVVKRHRADDFLLSPNVDGYSLAMDFHMTRGTRDGVFQTLRKITDEIAIPAGARFYFAKDSILSGKQLRASAQLEGIEAFRRIKLLLDPAETFQSDLYRRLI